MITMEKIDYVISVTGASYGEVREALLTADGDVDKALRLLMGEQKDQSGRHFRHHFQFRRRSHRRRERILGKRQCHQACGHGRKRRSDLKRLHEPRCHLDGHRTGCGPHGRGHRHHQPLGILHLFGRRKSHQRERLYYQQTPHAVKRSSAFGCCFFCIRKPPVRPGVPFSFSDNYPLFPA